MCAIMGVLNTDGEIVEKEILQAMQKALYHRGPDDFGLYTYSFGGGNVNLGVAFDRLSIRDLSMAGHQPMYSNDENVIIAFNGEIYNSEELRPQLLADGISFRGHSDTEVILYLYIKLGLDKMLDLLDGMYAISILDKRINKFYLIRDRIGEKPLYYYQKGNLFMFASEYKAFYAHPEFQASLNEEGFNEYCMFRYVSGEDTLLSGVKNLTPGSYLTFDNNGIHKSVYWTIPNSETNNLTEEENKEKLKQLIEKSVSRRLISDVPVGIQLSGGVDSSYLAHVVTNTLKTKLRTYGITFDNEFYTEEEYIDFVNQKLDCKTHKYLFGSAQFLDTWQKGTYYFEAPMNHEGTLALYLLNKDAKREITVMLSGDGPDELMGGYGRFVMTEAELQHPFVNGILRKVMAFIRGKSVRSNAIDSFISMTQLVSDKSYLFLRKDGNKRDIEKVYSKRHAIFDECSGNGIRKYMNYETVTWMQDILMRTDKIAMASSVEVRVPYLMPELIEFITTIPSEYLVSYSYLNTTRHTKKILKSLCADAFGEEFTYRKKKGLGCPLWDYFLSPEVENYILTTLMPSIKSRGLVNYDYIESIWANRHSLKKNANIGESRNAQQVLWTVFSFEIWAQMYLDGNPLKCA